MSNQHTGVKERLANFKKMTKDNPYWDTRTPEQKVDDGKILREQYEAWKARRNNVINSAESRIGPPTGIVNRVFSPVNVPSIFSSITGPKKGGKSRKQKKSKKTRKSRRPKQTRKQKKSKK